MHFFGHGVKNDQDAFGMDFFKKYEGEGDSLLFETNEGTADFVNQKELKAYCANYQVNFDFVFVAVCHFEFVGKIFSVSGAKHVICIKY